MALARHQQHGRYPLTLQAIADLCERRLGTSTVHALRHTFAHAMEQVGAKVSEIQARPGHNSLDTTGRYLAALRSAENAHAGDLANPLRPRASASSAPACEDDTATQPTAERVV
jgi:integrase